MTDRPRTIPIHLSLIRPILLMGAERELVLISGILAAVLVMSLARLLFTVIGVVFWALSLGGTCNALRSPIRSSRASICATRATAAYYAAQSRATSRLSTVREGMPC